MARLSLFREIPLAQSRWRIIDGSVIAERRELKRYGAVHENYGGV
jgi:hypothetical protein